MWTITFPLCAKESFIRDLHYDGILPQISLQAGIASPAYLFFPDAMSVPFLHGRDVTFSNLPCGKYTFWVCSSNNDGVWGPTNSWNIIVKEHWWSSATAIWLYSIIGFTIIAGFCIYFLKYNASKKKNKIESNKHTMEVANFQNKLDFFFNIVQEIRTPVMLVKNPADEIANINGLPENIRKNME